MACCRRANVRRLIDPNSSEAAELLFSNEGSELELSEDENNSDSESAGISGAAMNLGRHDYGDAVGLFGDQESDIVSGGDSDNDSDYQCEIEEDNNTVERGRGRERRQQRPGRPTNVSIRGRGGTRGSQSRRLSVEERRELENREWPDDPNLMPNMFQFTGNRGILCNLDNNSSMYDFLKQFIGKDIIKGIKEQTNKYARETIKKLKRANKLTPNSVWNQWKTVTESEIMQFLSLTIHMGLVPLPALHLYWSTHPIYKTVYASQIMTRDRFMSILSMLHVNDNDGYIPRGEPGHDPLHKVRPVFDNIMKACKISYAPEQKLTVDEGMCPFRGRVSFRVYIKMKPEKYGIKSYVLAEAKSGYLLAMDVYTGKTSGESKSIKDTVLDLVKDYTQKGHIIYFDRFYSSPDLFLTLNDTFHTKAVGTVQANRKGLPKVTHSQKLRKGEVIARRKSDLLFIKWKDVRDVYILTTNHTDQMVRVETARGNHEKIKPIAVVDYNEHKAGVDHNDQYGSDHPFRRRTLKWWKKFFFHLLHIAYTNAFILYNKTRTQKKDKVVLTDFLKEVSMALLVDAGIQAPVPIATAEHARLQGRHFISRIPPTEKKTYVARVCKVCSDKTKKSEGKRARTETCYECKKCGVSLCIIPCFELFHTKCNYWE